MADIVETGDEAAWKDERNRTAHIWSGGVSFSDIESVDRSRFPLWPHESDSDSYERLVSSCSHPVDTILVLGATPTLREIASRHARRVIVADVNSRMLVSTSALLREADPNREEWIHAFWLDLDLAKGSVDIVFADLIWWFFPTPEQERLRDLLASFLHPNGSFISRFYMRGADERDPGDILREYVELSYQHPAQKDAIYHMAFLRLAGRMSGARMLSEKTVIADFVLRAADEYPECAVDLRDKAGRWKLSMNLTLQDKETISSCLKHQFRLADEVTPHGYIGADALPVMRWEKARTIT